MRTRAFIGMLAVCMLGPVVGCSMGPPVPPAEATTSAPAISDSDITSWSAAGLEEYFGAECPPGETSLQREQREAAWEEEWNRNYRGQAVEWVGTVSDVERGGLVRLRCDNIQVSLWLDPSEVTAANDLQKGQQIVFRGRLLERQGGSYLLIHGHVTGSMPQRM